MSLLRCGWGVLILVATLHLCCSAALPALSEDVASWPTLLEGREFRHRVVHWLPSCITDPPSCRRPWELVEDVDWVEEPLWDRRELALAAVVASAPSSWRPFLARLAAGEPVTVVAMGSSITEAPPAASSQATQPLPPLA